MCIHVWVCVCVCCAYVCVYGRTSHPVYSDSRQMESASLCQVSSVWTRQRRQHTIRRWFLCPPKNGVLTIRTLHIALRFVSSCVFMGVCDGIWTSGALLILLLCYAFFGWAAVDRTDVLHIYIFYVSWCVCVCAALRRWSCNEFHAVVVLKVKTRSWSWTAAPRELIFSLVYAWVSMCVYAFVD